MAKIGLKRVELTGGEPGILLDSPMMSLMTKTTKKIAMTACVMANQGRYERSKGKHAGFAQQPYVGKVHRATHTCVGVVQTRTQSGARDHWRSGTLHRAIEANSVGLWRGTDADIAKNEKNEKQLRRYLEREDKRIAASAHTFEEWEADAERAYRQHLKAQHAAEVAARKAESATKKAVRKSIARHKAKVHGRKRRGYTGASLQKEFLRQRQRAYKASGVANTVYDYKASIKSIDRHKAKVKGKKRRGAKSRRP